MNPQDAARAVDLVRKIREKNALISQKIINTGSKIGDIGKQVTGKVLGGVASAVNTVANAYPPSVDILPGPMDNLAFMGLAGLNKGIKSLNKVDDVERGVVGAVKAVRNINKVDDLEREVVNSVKAVENVKRLPPVEGGVSKPLYRGSSKSINESITSQGGLYLTEDKSYATKFAGKNGTVSKVYADIKKPYDITEQVSNQPEIELLIEAPQNFPNEIADLKAKGYDAITYKGQVFVLNPSIIKSTSIKVNNLLDK